VFDVIEAASEGTFRGGVHELGLADNGVTFVADERNVPRLLPLEVVQRVKALREDIIAGKIQVPDR
jgi:basic membrane protein A